MNTITTPVTADIRPRIVMSQWSAFGVSGCAVDARIDVAHVTALVKGAPGVPVWSPPSG